VLIEGIAMGAFLLGAFEWFLQARLHPWAARLGLPARELSGSLPAGVDVQQELPGYGFRVRHLASGEYLLRPVYWNESGPSANPLLRGAVGVMRLHESAWEVQVRTSAGVALFGAAISILILEGSGILFGTLVVLLAIGAFATARRQACAVFERLGGRLEAESRGRPTRG
jgi:hypothetical protein